MKNEKTEAQDTVVVKPDWAFIEGRWVHIVATKGHLYIDGSLHTGPLASLVGVVAV